MELQSFVVERFQDRFQLLQRFGLEMWAGTVAGDMGSRQSCAITLSSPSVDQRGYVANAWAVRLLPIHAVRQTMER